MTKMWLVKKSHSYNILLQNAFVLFAVFYHSHCYRKFRMLQKMVYQCYKTDIQIILHMYNKSQITFKVKCLDLMAHFSKVMSNINSTAP